MQSSNIKRLKQQEADNRKLIQMYAELSLTFQLQQNIIKKLQYQRQFVKVWQNLISRYCVTIRISCIIVNVSCCAYYNQLKLVDDFMMNSLFKSITDKHLRWRFPKFFYRIRKLRYRWNHKRFYWVYCQLKLNIRPKRNKRLLQRYREPLSVPSCLGKFWSMDYIERFTKNI